MKQIANYWRYLQVNHVRFDSNVKNHIETDKNRGGSDNRPNIISISQSEEKVNGKTVQNDRICVLQKEKLVSLYNIPSCVFEISWYYIDTKR